MLTPRERVLKALNFELPDRVPVFNSFTPEVEQALAEYLGCSKDEVGVKIGNDVVRVAFDPPVGFETLVLEDGSFYDEWGIRYQKIGYYYEIVEHPLASLTEEAVLKYSFPDPLASGRLERAKELIRRYKETHAIMGFLGSTNFEPTWYLVGFEKTLVELQRDNPLIDYLLDGILQFFMAIGKQMVALGVDLIMCGDDVGTQRGMLISPSLWRRKLKPRLEKLVRSFKEVNPRVKVVYHSDGNILPIIPDLIEIEIDVLNPVQPKCMDPAEVKKLYGDRLSFFGTIDEQETLPFGSVNEVRKEVRERIATVGYNGGLILGATHNIQPDTPLRNIFALYDEVRNNTFSGRSVDSFSRR
ncbi:uroporphyrinogen decarboxylase family protein [Thermatribacter velox]|uniref:Uroporphyrinogen decarboxylase family protein n=1 Tax=Thermatribacter velox TaxID=3039681 RepID=A0ABZ2YC06_9BACT